MVSKVENISIAKYDNKFESSKSCVIIPTYNNAKVLNKVLQAVLEYSSHIIVVNDGSTDDTLQILDNYKQIKTISYKINKGKGYALRKGFILAEELGYENAIAIDSDGQHYPEDFILFLDALEENSGSIIIGARKMEGEKQDGGSSFANKFSNFWFKIETSKTISDTQSGYRLYPLKRINKRHYFTNRYEFEIEVIVRAAWRGIKIMTIPVNVFYPEKEERISHFRPGPDFTRISILNTILVIFAFFYGLPAVLYHNIREKSLKAVIYENIIKSNDSNLRLSVAIGFGVFMGIAPVWGWQMIIAVSLAHLFKLNKPITLIAANISIPPVIPFIIFGSYYAGALVLGNHLSLANFTTDISFDLIKQDLFQYIIGSFVLGIVSGIISMITSFFVINMFRKKHTYVS